MSSATTSPARDRSPLFDRLSARGQWLVAVGLALIGLAPMVGVVVAIELALMPVVGLWAIVVATTALLPLMFVWLPMLQALATPLARLTGVHVYYSPMLLATLPSSSRVELHAGTWWDLFLFSRQSTSGSLRRRILVSMLDGLLGVADRVAEGTIDADAKILGTSYIFNATTTRRLGFTEQAPTLFWRAFLWFAIVDMSTQLSFTRGRPTVAPVWSTHTAVTTGAELLARRGQIAALRRRLSSLEPSSLCVARRS